MSEIFYSNRSPRWSGWYSKIQRRQGQRYKQMGSSSRAYIASLVRKGPSLFRLVGDPGIGKTMISSFLMDELERTIQKTLNMTLEYYFKDKKRKTAKAIVRGLLLQLLRQRPGLSIHLQTEYNQMKDQVFTNFNTLWRIILNIVKDARAGEIYFLIDALDEW